MSDPVKNRKPILLLGVGNILQSDDGVGVYVVEKMRAELRDHDVEIVDGGTAGLDLLYLIENRRTVVVVDAVDGGFVPGTVYRFTPDDIESRSLRLYSLHQLGLLETLQMAHLAGTGPQRTIIVGVQPEVVEWGTRLSATVAGKLRGIIGRTRGRWVEIQQDGAKTHRRGGGDCQSRRNR